MSAVSWAQVGVWVLRAGFGVGEESVWERVLGEEFREGRGDWVGMRKARLERTGFFVSGGVYLDSCFYKRATRLWREGYTLPTSGGRARISDRDPPRLWREYNTTSRDELASVKLRFVEAQQLVIDCGILWDFQKRR